VPVWIDGHQSRTVSREIRLARDRVDCQRSVVATAVVRATTKCARKNIYILGDCSRDTRVWKWNLQTADQAKEWVGTCRPAQY
jgi:hypothetical protein